MPTTAGTRLLRRPARPQPAAIPTLRRRYPGEFVRLLATDRLGLFGRMARLGDVSQVVILGQRVMLLTHPDHIRRMLVEEQRAFVKGRGLERTRRLLGNGLLTAEGAAHLRQRRLIQPAFHRERLESYAPAVPRWCERIAAHWRDGAVRDLHADMMHLTLGVAAECFFGVDVERDSADVAAVLELSLRMFNYSILPLGELLELTPLPWVLRLRETRKRLDARIAQLIADRRAAQADGAAESDLLSTLVAASDAEGGMSDAQLRDEVVTLLLAGHETTANALTWTWYLLATHPEVERELHAEVDTVLAGRPPRAADLGRLPFARAVLAESMRLYPPAWTVERRATEPVAMDRYVIPRGAIVLASQYFVHRDRRWWDDAESFRPDRWRNEVATALRPKLSYFPFGAGTRICVGEHFAWMEGTLALAMLAQRWRMQWEGDRPPVPEPLVTLRPKGGLRMRLVARSGM